MAVTPLTVDELDAMPKSYGATWPRGVFLRCVGCGRTGTPTSVEGHRGRSERRVCHRRPEAFRTQEEADQRSVEQESELERSLDEQADAAADGLTGLSQPSTPEERLRARRLARAVRTKPPPPPKAPVGSGTTEAPEQAEEAPPTAVVHVAFNVPAEIYARFDASRRDPQFGFRGEIGDYFCAIEPAFWILVRWLEEGQPVPIADLMASLAA